MGRSQRHKIWEQGSNSAGAIHDEGMLAPGIAMQVNPSALNVLEPAEPLLNGGQEREGELEYVEVPVGPVGGPLQGSTLTGPIPESIQPPEPPDPEPGSEPTITSITPSSGVVGQAVQITIDGTGYTASSTVEADGNGVVSAYVSETQMTADLPSVATAGEVAITVTTDGVASAPTTFAFADGVEAGTEGGRALPAGPFTISLIEDHPDGLALTVDGATDIQVGDLAMVEATGNTSVNGAYDVIAIEDGKVIIENMFALTAPIEAKGRVTIS